MDIQKVCVDSSLADLNPVSQPQPYNVEIQEVNEDKSEHSSDNGEDQTKDV